MSDWHSALCERLSKETNVCIKLEAASFAVLEILFRQCRYKLQIKFPCIVPCSALVTSGRLGGERVHGDFDRTVLSFFRPKNATSSDWIPGSEPSTGCPQLQGSQLTWTHEALRRFGSTLEASCRAAIEITVQFEVLLSRYE